MIPFIFDITYEKVWEDLKDSGIATSKLTYGSIALYTLSYS